MIDKMTAEDGNSRDQNKGDSVKRWKMPCMVQQYLRDKNTTFNAWMHTHVYNFFAS